jgi:hypothetical protein
MREKYSRPPEPDPVSSWENVDPDVKQERLTEGLLQERIHGLRADIFLKLSEYFDVGNLRHKIGWAYFVLGQSDQAEGNSLVTEPDKEVLVMVVPNEGSEVIDGHHAPTIRIFTNEHYPSPDGLSGEWLGVDFTLDNDDGLQYSIGALSDDPKAQLNNVVLFWFDPGDQLRYTPNMNVILTPANGVAVDGLDGRKQMLYPLGTYESNYDPRRALEVGQELFNDIRDQEADDYTASTQ